MILCLCYFSKNFASSGNPAFFQDIPHVPALSLHNANVLFGDMSFVGTRPEVKKYVDMYTDEMLATLLMPAGITSVASIEYKDEENKIAQLQEEGKSIDEAYRDEVLPGKMKYNLEYIKQFSIWQDLKICAKTILEIF